MAGTNLMYSVCGVKVQVREDHSKHRILLTLIIYWQLKHMVLAHPSKLEEIGRAGAKSKYISKKYKVCHLMEKKVYCNPATNYVKTRSKERTKNGTYQTDRLEQVPISTNRFPPLKIIINSVVLTINTSPYHKYLPAMAKRFFGF